MLKILRKTANIIYFLIISFVCLVSFSLYFSIFTFPQNYKLLVVQSGSMEPTIKTGSIILVKKQDTYSVGDIISFKSSSKDSTTHRITKTQIVNGREFFTTKGDANQGEDRESVSVENILGKTIFIIPYLGYIVSFAKTQKGFIFLIVIPATIIIFSEILNLKKEFTNFINSKRKTFATTKQSNEN